MLWKSKELLAHAWELDQRHPTSYPTNTIHALGSIERRLSKKATVKRGPIRIPEPRKPKLKTLAELIPEELVKSVWSDNHSGAFEDAIRESLPDSWDDLELRKSLKAFKGGILHAVEGAYAVKVYGVEVLPKPKASILHRGLRTIAEAAGLGEQTNVGIAEFFDDLCPCGIRDHKQAFQKLSIRSGRKRW